MKSTNAKLAAIPSGSKESTRNGFGAERTKALRNALDLSRVKFARILGTDVRTVMRWETSRSIPRGCALAVMVVFERSISQENNKNEIIELIRETAAVGGLGLLIITLFDIALKHG